jgi:hypothetical protein
MALKKSCSSCQRDARTEHYYYETRENQRPRESIPEIWPSSSRNVYI